MKLKHLFIGILSLSLLICGCHTTNSESIASSYSSEQPISSESSIYSAPPSSSSTASSSKSNSSKSQSSSSSSFSSSSSSQPIQEIFTVRWVNYDGKLLKENKSVAKGTVVHYSAFGGPSRAEDENYIYKFSHWEPEEGPIYADTTYTAVYDQELKSLTATVKRNETYGFYTLILENGEPHYTYDSKSLKRAKYIYDSNIPDNYPEYRLDLIKEVRFGQNIETVSNMINSYNLSKVVFSSDVKYLKNALFNVANRAVDIVDVFFEGDCPSIGKSTLRTNGGQSLRCYYLEDKQGFSESYIDGQPFMVYGKSYALPEMTTEEYSLLSIQESRLLAKRIETLYKQNTDMMFYPLCDLITYQEIKTFALELTKDITNEKEKARACYEWLTTNFIYDSAYTYTQLSDDWHDHKAVCAGYTAILHDMLVALDIVSFYTRGIANYKLGYKYRDIALGNNQDFETHAWVTSIIGDEVVTMDATWGASGYASFDMSDETMNERYIALSVDFINVVPEGFAYYMYENITLLNNDNEIYVKSGDFLTQGLFSSYNFKINVNMTASDQNPYMLRNGVWTFNDNIGTWRYALPNGRMVSLIEIAFYQYFEKTLFSKSFNVDILDQYLPDYTIKDDYLFKFNESTAAVAGSLTSSETLTIPSTVEGKNVTIIMEETFRLNRYIKKVVMPSTIKRVEESAFSECENIEEIVFSENIEFIGRLAFAYCSRLKTLVLPDSLLELGSNAFSCCYSLETVRIGRNLNKVESYSIFGGSSSVKEFVVSSDNTFFKTHEGALYSYSMSILVSYCNGDGKKEVTIPNSVKEISERAFADNKNLETINLNEGLELIKSGAFVSSGITSLVIPSTVTLVDSQAFDICRNLTSIVMNCSDYALIYCGYQNVPFVEDVANFENGMLYAGKVLLRCVSTDSHIKIKEGTTNLAYGAFQNLSFGNGLYTKSVLLPSSLKHINVSAFRYAQKLEKVIMTNSINKVYDYAFEACSLLNEIIYVGTEEEFNDIEVDNNLKLNRMFIDAKKTFVSEVPEQYR